MDVKKRKIRDKDWERVEQFIKGELENRQKSQYRVHHESIWKEVDRQIKMEPMKRVTQAGKAVKKSWNSAFELGELSKASEIISADIRRITFPQERHWFESHVEIPPKLNEQTGVESIDAETQAKVDGLLRALMTQQQIDFGFKANVDLSIKEALHHGSFVATAEWDEDLYVEGGEKVGNMAAPTWVPHSMWNCYPDPSPAVGVGKMYYCGSMIIVSYMPRYKLEKMKSDGWMQAQFDKIPREEHKRKSGEQTLDTKDIQIVTYYGDIVIERKDGDDIYLPNSIAKTANGVICYYKPNELPFSPVIYNGYEKQDVRDPYFTSPIIKQSPMQKLTTILANKFVDGVSLKVEPPIVYDGNDPYFVEHDGPIIAPGIKTPTKGSTEFKLVETGDPAYALEGLQMGLRQLQEGTGVSAVRTGVANSDRQTATEVQKIAQGAEVRTVDFIDKLNYSLRSFLYMQHELNKKNMKEYSFYNENMQSQDFVRVTKKDLALAQSVHFDVTGARGLLGEEQRMQKMSAVTAFASQNPLFAPLLKPAELLIEGYRDAGVKNPERFVNSEPGETVPIAQAQQMAQEATAPMQEEIAKLQEELAKAKQNEQAKMIEAQVKAESTAADMQLKREEAAIRAEQEEKKILLAHSAEMERIRLAHEAKMAEIEANKEVNKEAAKAKSEPTTNIQFGTGDDELAKKQDDIDLSVKELTKLIKKPKKLKITAPSGKVYQVDGEQ